MTQNHNTWYVHLYRALRFAEYPPSAIPLETRVERGSVLAVGQQCHRVPQNTKDSLWDTSRQVRKEEHDSRHIKL